MEPIRAGAEGRLTHGVALLLGHGHAREYGVELSGRGGLGESCAPAGRRHVFSRVKSCQLEHSELGSYRVVPD